jgi:hypothetical protein
MSRILTSFIVVSVLCALPVASMAFFDKDGKTQIYQGTIKSSFGTEFKDCYIFHPDGTLEIVADNLIGVWDYQNLGESHFRYQGTLDTGLRLGVSGVKTALSLHGNEISEMGKTFKATLKRVKECTILVPANAARANSRIPQ